MLSSQWASFLLYKHTGPNESWHKQNLFYKHLWAISGVKQWLQEIYIKCGWYFCNWHYRPTQWVGQNVFVMSGEAEVGATVRPGTSWCSSCHNPTKSLMTSYFCKREDAAAQLRGPHRYSGGERREQREVLAPLCVQDSSLATSCLEPWHRIANDHSDGSHSYF